ncbi:MAG: GNAT family N-acetyltransferase [Rhodobacteraceae bacterium]|nr:GNAT family N-acetyltransferase [Paracoccaceae bacterium]
MNPDALARIHALSFTDTPRPWTRDEFAALEGQPGVLLLCRPEGFALGRIAGPEAELLTLAVDPAARRRGIARNLLAELEETASSQGVVEIFLEVATTNTAARALYEAAGYAMAGRRPRYYARAGAPAVDALVLRKDLSPR